MWIGIGLLVAIVGFLAGRFFVVPAIGGTPPNDLGWRGDSFKSCPGLPMMKCVSSTTEDRDRRSYIAPISFSGSAEEAKARILSIVNDMPRHTILSNEANYLHVEFRSMMWGFQDDTEFYFDSDENIIHVRSAARLGTADLNANRNRIESIRQQFNS